LLYFYIIEDIHGKDMISIILIMILSIIKT